MNVQNKTALITGAGSGIGRAMSISLAKRACHLALADINETGLDETIAFLQPYDIKLSRHVLDIGDPVAISKLYEDVIAQHTAIQLLINNAGVACGGTFLQTSEADFDWLMNINFHSVVRLTRLFLPRFLEQPEAAIVNISSLYGLVSPIGEAAYCASKFAVRGFSNALRHELMDTNLQITVVHPGGVATNIAKSARVAKGISQTEIDQKQKEMAKLLRLPPEKAGETIVRGIEKGKARIIVGWDAKLIALIERVAPVHYGRVLKQLMAWRSR